MGSSSNLRLISEEGHRIPIGNKSPYGSSKRRKEIPTYQQEANLKDLAAQLTRLKAKVEGHEEDLTRLDKEVSTLGETFDKFKRQLKTKFDKFTTKLEDWKILTERTIAGYIVEFKSWMNPGSSKESKSTRPVEPEVDQLAKTNVDPNALLAAKSSVSPIVASRAVTPTRHVYWEAPVSISFEKVNGEIKSAVITKPFSEHITIRKNHIIEYTVGEKNFNQKIPYKHETSLLQPKDFVRLLKDLIRDLLKINKESTDYTKLKSFIEGLPGQYKAHLLESKDPTAKVAVKEFEADDSLQKEIRGLINGLTAPHMFLQDLLSKS